MNKSLFALAIAAGLGFAASAQAADFKLLNEDPAGVGLNDTTPVAPIGGNPGTTRGAQARIVYQFAMDMWGGVLESSETINVYASFAPLTCTAASGTLAQAGANWTFNLTNADGKTRRYGSALADAVLGFDVVGYFQSLGQIPADDSGDIFSQFNGKLGQPGCLDGMSWYFGLDGKTPAGQVNFLNVVMHEIGHGLGAQSFINKTSGAFSSNISDPYAYNAYDNVLNARFESMTNAQRATAMRTPGRTVWTGAQVNGSAPLALNKRNSLRPTAPAAIAGKDYALGYAAFGPLAVPANFPNRPLVLINDGNTTGTQSNPPVPLTNTDGCSAKGAATGLGDTITYANAADVAGKIAVIDRGTCSFEYKARIAQDNGAAAVVIISNAAGPPTDMAAVSPSTGVTIPTVMISQADGNELKANLSGASAGLVLGNLLAGADGQGRVQLYGPTVVASGSTFSHFDTALSPDALMEPFDSPTVQANYNADLTPGLFADIGWTLNEDNGRFADCDTGLAAVEAGGLVLGSNLQAASNMCKTTSANRNVYTTCMSKHRDSMLAVGAITSKEALKVNTCVKKMSDNYTRY